MCYFFESCNCFLFREFREKKEEKKEGDEKKEEGAEAAAAEEDKKEDVKKEGEEKKEEEGKKIEEKKEEPAAEKKKEARKVSALCLSNSGESLYLGTEAGDIYVLDVKSFETTDHVIYKDVVTQMVGEDSKSNLGSVEVILEHPADSDRVSKLSDVQ